MVFKDQHILTAGQFDKEGLFVLFEEAKKMEEIVKSGRDSDVLAGKYMATLFFEASTRTRFSFEAAMMHLGGRVLSNADMKGTSSLRKQETLEDTAKVVSQMANVLVVRHYEVGSLAKFAKGSDVPVINAGEGPAEHPTQGALDLYTIWKERRSLDRLTVGMIGDLKNSRVQHSQCTLLKHFDVKFVLYSPESLKMPHEVLKELSGHEVKIAESVEDLVEAADVISVSRVQEERFEDKNEYRKVAGS
ncbi:aspartate carbamoyltransferase, partial [Candidatus Peregrinibacteria bacterium]|nr:aspartate carbamoyltransferase [Candidatus Peregrinibacteria bacterium]